VAGADRLEQSWQYAIQWHRPADLPRDGVSGNLVDQELHGVRTLENHHPIGATTRRCAYRRLDAELVDPLRDDELVQCRPVRRGDSDPDRADRPSLSRYGVKRPPAKRASRCLHELVATALRDARRVRTPARRSYAHPGRGKLRSGSARSEPRAPNAAKQIPSDDFFQIIVELPRAETAESAGDAPR
jgi:hypothetical protein